MAISFQQAIGMREAALSLRAERASVLSSNLANADTPNYKARDINFQEAFQAKLDAGQGLQSAGRIRATRANHIDFSEASRPVHEFYYRTPSQPSIDGNTVEESTEHSEFMKNNMEFQAAFTFLNSSFKGLRKAIKGE